MNTVPQDAPSAGVPNLDRDYLVHSLSELRRDQDRHLAIRGEGIRIHLDDDRTPIDGISDLRNMLIGPAEISTAALTLRNAAAQATS